MFFTLHSQVKNNVTIVNYFELTLDPYFFK